MDDLDGSTGNGTGTETAAAGTETAARAGTRTGTDTCRAAGDDFAVLGNLALPTGTLPAITGTVGRTGTAGNFTLPTLPAVTGAAGRTGTAGNFALATLPTLPGAAAGRARAACDNFAQLALDTGRILSAGAAVALPGRDITGID